MQVHTYPFQTTFCPTIKSVNPDSFLSFRSLANRMIGFSMPEMTIWQLQIRMSYHFHRSFPVLRLSFLLHICLESRFGTLG